MGVAFYIELNKDDKDLDFNPWVEGKPIAWIFEELESFCKKHQIKAISDYVYQDISELEDEFEEHELPPQIAQWFDAQEGILFIRNLRDKLIEEQSKLLDDNLEYALSQFLEVFTNAKRVGARWHLAVDY